MHFNFKDGFKNIHESKTIRGIIIGIGIAIIILLIFSAGISVGEHRARFAGHFGDNFEKNFMGPRGDLMKKTKDQFFRMQPGGHGAIGKIISIKLPQIIISGPDNLEKTVLINASTTIRKFQENIQSSDLKNDDFIVIIGNPNDQGQIEAKLIRIMPQSNEIYE